MSGFSPGVVDGDRRCDPSGDPSFTRIACFSVSARDSDTGYDLSGPHEGPGGAVGSPPDGVTSFGCLTGLLGFGDGDGWKPDDPSRVLGFSNRV